MPEPAHLNQDYSLRFRAAIICLLIACLTFIIYAPALQGGFVNWDDDVYVYGSQKVRSIDFNSFKWAFTAEVASLWHPLTLISHSFVYAVWGTNPWGHHFVNILFHSFNTSLVFILAVRLIGFYNLGEEGLGKGALVAGTVTALLFGIHPLHVESVAWISERKDVLYTFFYLLGLLTYLKYTISKGSKRHLFYTACLISFILALLSKPAAVTLPIVLLILDCYPLNRLEKKGGLKGAVIEKLPFLLLSVLTSVVTIWASHLGGALWTSGQLPIIAHIFIVVRAYIFYLSKMMMPLNLAPLYPHPVKINFLSSEYIGSMSLFLAISLLSFKKNRLFSAVWLYYIVTLIPVIGVVQAGEQAVADRYSYLPSLGPFLLAGLGIGALFERGLKKRMHLAAIVALFILGGILTSRTLNQISIWRDSISLWSNEIKFFPDLDLPYDNRGNAYAVSGNYQQAIIDYTRAIALNPRYAGTYANRGTVYRNMGKYQQALSDYSRAIELEPENTMAYSNRGDTYNKLGNYQDAIRDYGMAIRLNPQFGEVYYKLGTLYSGIGDTNQAVVHYKKAATLGSRQAH